MERRKSKLNLLTMINTALSGAVLMYVVNTEHRITKVETELKQIVEIVKGLDNESRSNGRNNKDVKR